MGEGLIFFLKIKTPVKQTRLQKKRDNKILSQILLANIL